MKLRFHISGSNRRSLRVEQNADGTFRPIRQFANLGNELSDPVRIGVAHVESKHVGAVLDHLAQNFSFLCHPAQRADDFCPAHPPAEFRLLSQKQAGFAPNVISA